MGGMADEMRRELDYMEHENNHGICSSSCCGTDGVGNSRDAGRAGRVEETGEGDSSARQPFLNPEDSTCSSSMGDNTEDGVANSEKVQKGICTLLNDLIDDTGLRNLIFLWL